MSGVFNRTRYDVSYFPEFIDQETGPGVYEISELAGERPDKCVSNFGPRSNSIRGNGEIPSGDLLDRKEIENYLLNLDIPNSRTLSLNTLQEKNKRLKEYSKNHKHTVDNCSDFLDPRYSRLDMTVLNLKSKYINRYDFPILNPLNSVYYGIPTTSQTGNSRHGLSSRTDEKDKYRNLIQYK